MTTKPEATALLYKRINLLRSALLGMQSEQLHSMDPGSFEYEADDAIEQDDALAMQTKEPVVAIATRMVKFADILNVVSNVAPPDSYYYKGDTRGIHAWQSAIGRVQVELERYLAVQGETDDE